MNNICVCCGREIPEGRHVCPICEKYGDRRTRTILEADTVGGLIELLQDLPHNMKVRKISGGNVTMEIEHSNPKCVWFK